jgi:ATP phosphoribosyltransferase
LVRPCLLPALLILTDGVSDSRKYVACKYNIQRAHLEAASKITPGKHAPTITTLFPEEEGWIAVEAMVEKNQISDRMDELWAIGARDILVLPLLNTRTSD